MITGIKHDNGKPRWWLLPWDAVTEVVKVLNHGAVKYAADNWRYVEPWDERYFDAAVRHMVAWRAGEKLDPESGLHHMAHASCCILFMLAKDMGQEKGEHAKEETNGDISAGYNRARLDESQPVQLQFELYPESDG